MSSAPIVSINPSTEEVNATFDPANPAEIDHALDRAAAAARAWKATPLDERAQRLSDIAAILRRDREQLARHITTEMGKPLAEALAEVDKSAWCCDHYAEEGPKLLSDQYAQTSARESFVTFEPLGIVLAVMPWNFPLWQVFRFAPATLLSGNGIVLKHASNVPQTALYLGELFVRAGFPAGAFQTLLVGSDAVEAILTDPRVRAATLTGSEQAGRSIAAVAGRELKKTVLELGGSDPFVVLPTADLDRAAQVATTARCQNNGQSCIAAKRFIVHTDVYDQFVDAFVAHMSALTVGDPMAAGTDVGPLATRSGREDIEEQVADAVAKGATVRCGGQSPAGDGWWYPPTVITDITPDMRIFSEEVFGPVAAVYRASSLDEALELANGSSFGLGANAWTDDPREQQRLITELDAGAVFVNGMVTSYPQLPFGGVKNSGYGRELSAAGIREFCNLKAVWVGDSGETSPGSATE